MPAHQSTPKLSVIPIKQSSKSACYGISGIGVFSDVKSFQPKWHPVPLASTRQPANISFSNFTWPKEIITITRQVDTCIAKPVPKQPVFRIGPYVGLSLNSFTKSPGIETGAQIDIKDQLTISVGGLYFNGIYGNVRVGWLLK